MYFIVLVNTLVKFVPEKKSVNRKNCH